MNRQLRSRSGGNTLREHILLRPNDYIGSLEKCTQTSWVLDGYVMVPRAVTYCPGLHNIFDDILVYAASNKQRDPSMDYLCVEVEITDCRISVFYNGRGIPVEFHDKQGVYAPEMFFGHLHAIASSNYDEEDDLNKMRNDDYGVKLANLFSTEFAVETADGCRMKRYMQVFSENAEKSVPHITDCNQGENWTMINFKPDLARFNMTYLEEDHVKLMWKRVVDMAGILGDTVRVEWDGVRLHIKSFQDYVDRHVESPLL